MNSKMMMISRQLFILLLTVQFMYKLCYGVQVIVYIFLLNIISYLILIINQNLILCDHENKIKNMNFH